MVWYHKFGFARMHRHCDGVSTHNGVSTECNEMIERKKAIGDADIETKIAMETELSSDVDYHFYKDEQKTQASFMTEISSVNRSSAFIRPIPLIAADTSVYRTLTTCIGNTSSTETMSVLPSPCPATSTKTMQSVYSQLLDISQERMSLIHSPLLATSATERQSVYSPHLDTSPEQTPLIHSPLLATSATTMHSVYSQLSEKSPGSTLLTHSPTLGTSTSTVPLMHTSIQSSRCSERSTLSIPASLTNKDCLASNLNMQKRHGNGAVIQNIRDLLQCKWMDCVQQFSCVSDFIRHVNAHAHVERPDVEYQCKWGGCPRKGKGFNARYKMILHIRTHTNEKPHKCSRCGKAFSRLENLKIHTRTHTGEKPYHCPFEGCNKAYSNSSDRFKHVRTHTEDKPYACKMPGCSKRYTDPSSLRKHVKTQLHHYTKQNTKLSPDLPVTLTEADDNEFRTVTDHSFFNYYGNICVSN